MRCWRAGCSLMTAGVGGAGVWAPRDTVIRRLAHEPLGWRPTVLEVTVRHPHRQLQRYVGVPAAASAVHVPFNAESCTALATAEPTFSISGSDIVGKHGTVRIPAARRSVTGKPKSWNSACCTG